MSFDSRCKETAKTILSSLAGLAILLALASKLSAELVGHWTFEPDQEHVDLTGNFPDLLLMGDAAIVEGKLDVNGMGTEATGWAVTDSDSGGYSGPPITSKTLLVWATLESLGDGATAGAVISLDRISEDYFDGIIFGERQTNRWMNGSSGFQRTQDLSPGFEETETGQPIFLAFTYNVGGDQMEIVGYRNGEFIGQYAADHSEWDTGDAEVFFGIRHGSTGGGPGALDAMIEEARLYAVALSADRIAEIFALGPIVGEDRDGDGDGLPDAWERLHFGNLDDAGDGDPDGDGLSNAAELERGTVPSNPDSDEDGASDRVETGTGIFVSAEDRGTDPLNPDTDGDGLRDGTETNTGVFVGAEDTGTDPHNADTDGDGFGDFEELTSDPPSDPFDPKSPVTEVSDYLIGHWSFESGDPLTDEAGNFPDLLLMGDAVIVQGEFGTALDLNGTGTEATGWAVTDSDNGAYTGPPIESKTLSAWVRLQGLDDVATAGSLITIDRVSGDHFDGIIFAERQANRWMNGSSGFQRTQDFVPGFEETRVGELINLTITYEARDNGTLIVTAYRDFAIIGQYETEVSTWDTGDAEIFFGKRHGNTAGGPGALDVLIEVATIWNVALTEEQVTEILPELYYPRLRDDADGDGLPDDWECEHFAEVGQACDLAFLEGVPPAGDPDGDGLDNAGEWRARTDPLNPDTDDDGLPDGVETKTRIFVDASDTGTDPLIRDSDGDGLLDGVENPLLSFDPDNPLLQPGTDPNNANTDGDRLALLDGDEVTSDPPTDPTDRNDPPEPPVLLVGHWTFEPGEELVDKSGNFPDLILQDNGAPAEITVIDGRGVLDVNGEGTTATGWAVTDSDSGEYTGPEITDKTLVVWATLEGLGDVASAGSLMTIDSVATDQFDGIIFAEREPNRWMNGSSFFSRTQDWNPGFEETAVGEPLMMAISYEHLDDGILEVVGYRNGEEIGRYGAGEPSSWEAGDAEVLFGVRHGSTAGGPGGLDALIDEARLYADVLSPEQIEQLFQEGPGGAADRFNVTAVVRDVEGNLTLTWESEPGQLFAIEESLGLTNPWTEIGTEIPATEAPALLTSATLMSEGVHSEAYYRVVRIPLPPLFEEGFEGDVSGWTMGVIEGLEPTATAWEIGAPTGGPGAAFAGTKVAATDLDANYVDGTGIYLRSPAIDLTGVARPRLEFWYFLEAGDGEGGRLNLLNPDGTFRETIAVFDGQFRSVGEWTQESIRLQPVEGTVVFEFELLSEFDDTEDNGAGWYLDNLSVDD